MQRQQEVADEHRGDRRERPSERNALYGVEDVLDPA